MKNKAAPFIEYASESTAACVITMAQGNLLALTASHMLAASQTGIIAGTIAAVSLFAARTRNRWLISAVLGVATGIVDFFVHPGMFGSVATEAIVTGLAAALLSYGVGASLQYFRADPSVAS